MIRLHYLRRQCNYYDVCLAVVFILLCSNPASAISCYSCSSSKDVHCTENMDVRTTNLRLSNCSHIFNSRYCVKTIGMFKGEVGTTRFCSSEDLGNLCDPQQRMGDVRGYRSCFHTCSTDGCNTASTLTSSVIMLISIIILMFIIDVHS